MKAHRWVVCSLLFVLLPIPAEPQSLSCLGGSITTYETCPPCSSGRQTRAQAMCTQPADLQGRGCGSRTCESCTCEPDMFGRPGPSSTGSSRPAGTKTAPSRPVQQTPNPEPAPRGARINNDPIVILTEREVQQCIRRVGRIDPAQPTGSQVAVTLNNTCQQCISAKVTISNVHGEISYGPLAGTESFQKSFRPNLPHRLLFHVRDRNEWVWKDNIAVDVYEARMYQCGRI